MNESYKKAILIFGVFIPLFLIGLVIILVSMKAKSIDKEYAQKKLAYEQSKQSRNMITGLKASVIKNEDQLKAWQEMMKRETRGTFIQHWNKIEAKYDNQSLSKTSHNWGNRSTGLGAGVSQPASQITMSFTGTYEAMQKSLLELETILPQIQLDEMSFKPSGSRNLIQLKTTYTLWTQ